MTNTLAYFDVSKMKKTFCNNDSRLRMLIMSINLLIKNVSESVFPKQMFIRLD
jgi:hypothetical protein